MKGGDVKRDLIQGSHGGETSFLVKEKKRRLVFTRLLLRDYPKKNVCAIGRLLFLLYGWGGKKGREAFLGERRVKETAVFGVRRLCLFPLGTRKEEFLSEWREKPDQNDKSPGGREKVSKRKRKGLSSEEKESSCRVRRGGRSQEDFL